MYHSQSLVEKETWNINFDKISFRLQILTRTVHLHGVNPIPPGHFWSSWAWGGGSNPPPPLHKSESIDAIVMKLGG